VLSTPRRALGNVGAIENLMSRKENAVLLEAVRASGVRSIMTRNVRDVVDGCLAVSEPVELLGILVERARGSEARDGRPGVRLGGPRRSSGRDGGRISEGREMPVSGGFVERYSEYGPGIRRSRALTTPERRRNTMPYALLEER